jgi:hypothetical protein
MMRLHEEGSWTSGLNKRTSRLRKKVGIETAWSEFMIRAFLSGLSFVFAIVLGFAAFHLLFSCILPWRKSPDTTHVTWIFAGTQFTGWLLFVPLAVLLVLSVAITILGLWILKTRN